MFARLAIAALATLALTAAAASAEPLARIVATYSGATRPPTTQQCLRRLRLRCYDPDQLQAAYDLSPLLKRGIDGGGRTIVIIDSFGSPTIASDLRTFDRTFGLPAPPSFRIYQPVGAVPPPSRQPSSDRVGWATETTLDVEWAHVFAPGARIALLETPVDETEGDHGMPQMMGAVRWAVSHHIGRVISMSFGATEQTFSSSSTILQRRSALVDATKHGVALVSAAGDTGATDFERNMARLFPSRATQWPASDPLVLATGGTSLKLDPDGHRLSPDVVWSDPFGAGGGGRSTVFARPAYQARVASVVGENRGLPDISLSSSDEGAADVYLSFGGRRTWTLVAGTSWATVELAGLLADVEQLRAGHKLADAPAHVYALRRGIIDITRGSNTFRNRHPVPGFAATPGYDLASGLGTVDAARFVPGLAGS